jgi:hypothetical protein
MTEASRKQITTWFSQPDLVSRIFKTKVLPITSPLHHHIDQVAAHEKPSPLPVIQNDHESSRKQYPTDLSHSTKQCLNTDNNKPGEKKIKERNPSLFDVPASGIDNCLETKLQMRSEVALSQQQTLNINALISGRIIWEESAENKEGKPKAMPKEKSINTPDISRGVLAHSLSEMYVSVIQAAHQESILKAA